MNLFNFKNFEHKLDLSEIISGLYEARDPVLLKLGNGKSMFSVSYIVGEGQDKWENKLNTLQDKVSITF